MLRTTKQGNFTLLIGHVIGVDHAGHTYSSSHSEIERKLRDTEKLIKDIIEEMDEDTVIMVFGDHGMTDDGNHGGASQTELRSVLFAYSKKGFPIKTKLPKSEYLDSNVKQVDLASFASSILGLALPFQNLGVLHPYFFMDSKLGDLSDKMNEHLKKLLQYIEEYCNTDSEEVWCAHEIDDIKRELSN
jgi:GPI ethanolamine phosphate transferase 3 subunit O